ncbi:MAG TPA: hypothetical protein VM095_21370 [Pyrinomonadaceae bacterium]|nr:hypothetical protein [Pyrinomonadaceae bacterium]
MKTRIIGIPALVLFVSVSSAWAQTLSELETKYGAPVKSYAVSENIWMSPELTDEGQLCMARLYPKKIDAATNYLNSMLSLREVKDVFDELAPVAVRGKKKEDYGMLFIGNMIFAGFGYEHVRINFTSPLTFAPSGKVSSDKRQTEEVAEFPGVQSAEIVIITWLTRKCSSR